MDIDFSFKAFLVEVEQDQMGAVIPRTPQGRITTVYRGIAGNFSFAGAATQSFADEPTAAVKHALSVYDKSNGAAGLPNLVVMEIYRRTAANHLAKSGYMGMTTVLDFEASELEQYKRSGEIKSMKQIPILGPDGKVTQKFKEWLAQQTPMVQRGITEIQRSRLQKQKAQQSPGELARQDMAATEREGRLRRTKPGSANFVLPRS